MGAFCIWDCRANNPAIMSQLLNRLEQSIRSETDPVRRGVLTAEKSCYLSRVGRFAEARKAIDEIHSVFGDGRSGRVTSWKMLAEGLLGLFEELNPAAFDRVFRAQFLAVALGEQEVVAIASAWKAHFEFETSNFSAMIQSLRLAIASAKERDHGAHARLSMVLCDAFFLCGERTDGQIWFTRSRDHALKDGDQASIEALVYNRAAFGLAWLRARRCIQELSTDAMSLARLEVNSARNLQNLTGIAAFPHLIELCNARLLILEEKFDIAIEKLGSVRHAGPFAAYNFSQPMIDLEIAYCLHRIGRTVESRELTLAVQPATFAELDLDEQLVAAWLRREMAAADTESLAFASAQAALESSVSKYVTASTSLSKQLNEFRGSSLTSGTNDSGQ